MAVSLDRSFLSFDVTFSAKLTQPAITSLEKQDDTASGGGGTSLTISNCSEILSDAHLGDSISINGLCFNYRCRLNKAPVDLWTGTCLTITSFSTDHFKVGVSPETLRRTNLGSLREKSPVNLERAVSASTRMGGHFVQGHVDTIAQILSVTPDGNALKFRLQPREKVVLRYIVEKGYVTLDGASLTITQVNDAEGWWEVMLIAYTQDKVVMAKKKKGEGVNVEVDMVGKYVEKSVLGYFDRLDESNPAQVGGGVLEQMVGRMIDAKLNDKS